MEGEYSEVVAEIKESLYVDDILTGGSTVEQVQTLKSSAIVIFDRADFALHKWYSNEKSLEEPVQSNAELEQSFIT